MNGVTNLPRLISNPSREVAGSGVSVTGSADASRAVSASSVPTESYEKAASDPTKARAAEAANAAPKPGSTQATPLGLSRLAQDIASLGQERLRSTEQAARAAITQMGVAVQSGDPAKLVSANQELQAALEAYHQARGMRSEAPKIARELAMYLTRTAQDLKDCLDAEQANLTA